ncbi:hypothetical protein MOBT1_000524 [Malassezia obtusa]|uniref:Bromo domain-containing protein n=1 Tax=Malassezia obtusa TaxID=76774 RepID=A0AAF0DZF9_9BASI|nr:hypothetical protein MOBT1_000524 [Malassezia obtusa]
MSTGGGGRAILLKGPTLNSKVFLTALPERLDVRRRLTQDLLAKARELFHVPADCTPQLYVPCPSSVGTAYSEQRGAILLADAMPFVRDRELLTVRWTSSDSPARDANARVQWDPKLPATDGAIGSTRPSVTPVWRGPQARAAHVARVLERERSYAEEWTDNLRKPVPVRPEPSVFGKPAAAQKREPLSPPPSSPNASPERAPEMSRVEAPASPTPLRSQDVVPAPLVWNAQEEPGTPPQAGADALGDTPGLFGLGALCARLNPFARGTPQKDGLGPAPSPPKSAKEPRVVQKTRTRPLTIPEMAHVQGTAAYEVMTQVLASVREHPCAMQFRAPMPYDLRRFCERRGRVVDLGTIGVRVSKRDFGSVPLTRFAEELAAYLENLVAFYGEHSYQAHAAHGLGKFAETLLKELSKQKPSEPRADAKEPAQPAGPAARGAAAKGASEPSAAKPEAPAKPSGPRAQGAGAPASEPDTSAKQAPAPAETPVHAEAGAGKASGAGDTAPKADAAKTGPAKADAPGKRAPKEAPQGAAAKTEAGAAGEKAAGAEGAAAPATKRRGAAASQPVAKRTRRSSRVKT